MTWAYTKVTSITGRTASTTNGSNVIVVNSSTNFVRGHLIEGAGISVDTVVTAISGTNITLSQACTATATGVAVTLFIDTLTQTGTDTNLSGIMTATGLPSSMVTLLAGAPNIYQFNRGRVAVSGSLSWLCRTDKISFRPTAYASNTFSTGASAIVLIDGSAPGGSPDPGELILCGLESFIVGSGGFSDYFFVTNTGTDLTLKNCEVWGSQSVNVTCNLTITGQVKFTCPATANNQSGTIFIYGSGTTTFTSGAVWKVYGGYRISPSRTGYSPINSPFIAAGSWDFNGIGATQTIPRLIYESTSFNNSQGSGIALRDGSQAYFRNAPAGSAISCGLWGTAANNKGIAIPTRYVSHFVQSAAGVPLQNAVIYTKDVLDGNQGNPSDWIKGTTGDTEWDFTANKTYIWATDATGNTTAQDVMLAACYSETGGSVFKRNIRTISGTNDALNYTVLQYNSLQLTSPVVQRGAGALVQNWNLLPDTNVTLTEAAAGALIVISSLDDVYDAAKYWKTRPVDAQLEYPSLNTQPVAANGTQLVLSDTLVIDGAATSALAVNTSAHEITINPSTLAKGAKFDTIQAAAITIAASTSVSANLTGAVTNNGTLASGVNITGNVTQATPTSVTNIFVNGDVIYNTNTPITIVYTSPSQVVSGTVSNLGTGLVTITLVGEASIGTVGSNVVTQRFANVTAPNIVVGSRVQLYDMTNNVELYNDVLSAALNYQHTYTGDITVRLRATYQLGTTAKLPVESTGLLTVSGLSFLNSQTNDAVYIANILDGSTVTEYTPDYPNLQIDIAGGTNTSVQRLYNWTTYIETTADGIRYLFSAITATDQVNYIINQDILDVKLDNTGATPVLVIGGVITRKDGTTVIASTSGSIQIDPAKAYLANSASISADLQTIKNYTAAAL